MHPVFLPQAGCGTRCVYCDQAAQTGQALLPLATVLRRVEEALAISESSGRRAMELAFYGGCFTALPAAWIERFLDLAGTYRHRGVVDRVRCSTRPDAVDAGSLARWRERGLDCVELGVQSFQDHALAASGRNYSGETARRACALVREAGMDLGVQLMPGLPGWRPGEFLADLRQALGLQPAGLRLYPCLVLEGTPLAKRWREGGHVAWSLSRAAWVLAMADLACLEAGVPLWRVGLLDQPGLADRILAGPWHPALGGMARSRALFLFLRRHGILPSSRPRNRPWREPGLTLPRRASGLLWGAGGELRPLYARHGLRPEHVQFEPDGEEIRWA